MCDLCIRKPEPIDYCICPLWEPCSCGAEAPITRGYEEMNPWRVDRDAETLQRRLACRESAA